MPSERKGSSPWLWIGCGCLLAIGLLVGGVAGCGYFGFTQLRDFQEEMFDPEARDRKAADVLGSDLPAGYRSQLAFGVPFFFDLAVLTDGELLDLVEGSRPQRLSIDHLGEHVFAMVKFKRGTWNLENAEGLFDGSERDGVSLNPGFQIGGLEELEKGTLELEDQTVDYSLCRGVLRGAGEDLSGTMAFLSVNCPRQTGSRLGVWFRRDGEIGEAPATMSSDEVQTFVGNLALCD